MDHISNMKIFYPRSAGWDDVELKILVNWGNKVLPNIKKTLIKHYKELLINLKLAVTQYHQFRYTTTNEQYVLLFKEGITFPSIDYAEMQNENRDE